MTPMFHDPALQETFDREGYVVLPFIDASAVQRLRSSYFSLLGQRGGAHSGEDLGFPNKGEISYVTFADKDPAYKRAVYDAILREVGPLYPTILSGYVPMIANYFPKPPGGGEVPLHQNYALVDEKKFTSVSLWCPLLDSRESNGTLQVVPRSHKRFAPVRGPMVPWELTACAPQVIAERLTPLNVPAGTAVVLDDSLVHYSGPNRSDELRLAVQVVLMPEEAEAIHHHMDPRQDPKTVHIVKIDRELLFSFHPWAKPTGAKHLSSITFECRPLSLADFDRRLTEPRFDEGGRA